jgi:hypothetical protein
MCALHLSIPDLALPQQVQLLRRFARVGDPAQVEAAYEAVASGAPHPTASTLRAEARELRARWN